MRTTTHFQSQWRNAPFEEWRYLQDQWRWLLLLAPGALSMLPTFIDSRMIPTPNASLLGVLIFVFAVTGFWLADRYRRLGAMLFIAGTWVDVLLVIQWWPFSGASVLMLLPVLLATHFLGLLAGLLAASLAGVLMLAPIGLIPLHVPGERAFSLFLIAAFWVAQCMTQYWSKALVSALYTDYLKAKAELDVARDHRLELSQVNRDLADAYVQMRRLNNLLQASRMEAEAARRAKEEFVANVSHELRTPLNMIIGLSEMIVSSPDSYDDRLPPTLLSDVRVIHRNSQHLSQLINDVLDLSQTEAGRLQLHREWIDPHVIVDETLEAIKPLFKAKGLYLRKEAPEELPMAYCDPVRMRQVLLNLLSNAGRFTIKGGATVQVSAAQNALIFSVTDTGPGIPESEQERIFEPFHQVQGTVGEAWNGSGLGLRICQQFVELHDGKMWLESTLGAGTSFRFTLPCALFDVPVSSASRWVNPYTVRDPYEKHSTQALPQIKRRIVLLDPEQMLTRRLQGYLHGADVVSVSNIDELKGEIERLLPDLLFINDIRVMEDKDFIRKAITLPPRMPVLSCYVPGQETAWKYLNVRNYLTKPMVREAFLEAVTPLVEENATILVAEDDRDTARLARRQLVSAQRGYRVLTAPNAKIALEMLRTRAIDLLCLDLNLPDVDGYELLCQKNADSQIRDVPVVVISARDPTGEPIIAGRLRIEMADGLSIRDIVRCIVATDWALSTGRPVSDPGQKETLAGSPAFG